MSEETKNLPAVPVPNPLQLVQKHKSNHDLVFVAEENLRTGTMFLPEVVVIHATQDDFHNISGKYMPKGHQTDRIGEAAGISFIAEHCGTRMEGKDVYVGYAQGKKRLPDGTWRSSSVCEYEFAISVRSEEDFLNDAKKQQPRYTNEVDKKAHVLQLKKFARQRAGTGARLKVIRELTGMPVSFKQNEIGKAMVFSRVAVHTDLLLQDPRMRDAAIKAALSASGNIYGPTKDDYQVENRGTEGAHGATTQIEAPKEQEEEIPFGPGPEEQNHTEADEIRVNIAQLKQLREIDYLSTEAQKQTDAILAQETPSLEATTSMIERILGWLKDPRVVKKHGEYKGAGL